MIKDYSVINVKVMTYHTVHCCILYRYIHESQDIDTTKLSRCANVYKMALDTLNKEIEIITKVALTATVWDRRALQLCVSLLL